MSIDITGRPDTDNVEGFTINGRHYYGLKNGHLNEICPFDHTSVAKRWGNDIQVGSAACSWCEHYKKENSYSGWIICELFAEQEAKESVTLINF